ncbi:uncharacterized protein [Clytia hemisphaerica]|uniref:Cnidarian restricted protein n=1 Tax=Clytia hemisphaerica TaxID=252671 RepID=A0A7M5XFU8_9CNID
MACVRRIILTITIYSTLSTITNCQILELKTQEDLEENILQNEKVWLVSIHQTENQQREIVHTEDLYRGIFNAAQIERRQIGTILDSSLAKETNFIIFPYGSKRSKQTKQKHAVNLNEALKIVSEFIPDITTRLDSNVDGTNSQLRAFFQKIFMTRPIKFPVIYFTENKEPPIEIRALALKYSSLFQFGVISRPTKNALNAYAIKSLPHFSGYIIENVTSQPRLKNYIYQGQLNGPSEYPFLVHFLYLLHKNHFKELPKVRKPKSSDDVRNAGKDDEIELDLEETFSEDFELFHELYKMFPMEYGTKDEL